MEKVCDSCLYLFTTELDNPALWSKDMVQKALQAAGDAVGHVDIEKTRLIVKNYLAVLRDVLRDGCKV